jgi:hypothetical protein
MVGIVAGSAAVILLGGGYALSASSASNSLCPPNKSARFLLLMDPVPNPAVRSEMEINYDVCGLRSGTPFRGKVRLTQQVVAPKKSKKKKKAAVPKPLVVTFEDKVDGVATRRSQEVNLGATKPGVYTLELIVVDNQGRERKKVQKIAVKAKP